MPPQAAPFWLCHECGAQMRPIMVDNVPHCASCNSEFLEILDEDVNPDPFHELPHPPTRPGAGPPPVPPRPAPGAPGGDDGGDLLATLLGSVFGRLDDTRNPDGDGPPAVPPRPGAAPGASPDARADGPRGPRTRTYNWGNASFTITTGGDMRDVFGGGGPPQLGPGATDPDAGLDAYFGGFGAGPTPPQNRAGAGGRGMRSDEASGALFLQALFDMLAEDGGAPGQFPGRGRFGDYVMTEDGYNDILERLMQAAGPQGPLPATNEVINGLPRSTFDEETLKESQFKDCPICMEDFAVTETVVHLPCKHIFHPDCLIPWLKSNGSCPVCRFSLVPDSANAARSAVQNENPVPGPAPPHEQDEPAHRNPLSPVSEFISTTFSNTLHRLFGQSGAAPANGEATPPATPPQQAPSEAEIFADANAALNEASNNVHQAQAVQAQSSGSDYHAPLPAEYHPGVFPDSPPHRFVRRMSTLSNSFVPPDDTSDPPDADLGDLDPPDRVAGTGSAGSGGPTRTDTSSPTGSAFSGFNPGNMSGLSSGIPADYRAMHARREREQHERERQASNAFNSAAGPPPNGGNPNYWDDID